MYHRTIAIVVTLVIWPLCFAAESKVSSAQLNVKCSAQKLAPVIDNYYHQCHSGMVNNSCEEFLKVFKELMPRSDCAREFDTEAVPSIWLLGDGQFSDYHGLVHDLVFEKLYSIKEFSNARKEASALFYSEEFQNVLDAWGEEYEDEWKAHEQKKKK